MSARQWLKQKLEQKENNRYQKLLAARQVSYREWLQQKEQAQSCVQQSMAQAQGCDEEQITEHIPCYLFIASEGELAEHALNFIQQYFSDHPECSMVYGDEDIMADGILQSPWFKPDWSPDTFASCFYLGSVIAVRREALGGMGDISVIRITEEQFPGYRRMITDIVDKLGRKSVGHIPQILFHGISEKGRTPFLELQDVKDGIGEKDTMPTATISIIIPSKDNPDILQTCVESCLRVSYSDLEIIIVDNGSCEEHRQRITSLVRQWNQKQYSREQWNRTLPNREQDKQFQENSQVRVSVQYHYEPMPFHFSKMCNLGAQKAHNRCLLFLNDDIELVEPGCLERMAALCSRTNTGAVGMKLYYPDSHKIQHAGITNLPMGPVHKLQFLPDDENYYFNSNRGLRNVLAVTGACLMVDRDKFEKAGEFSEQLAVAFNDVDLCYSLYEAGYDNVCMCDCYAYHHESLSRGNDDSEEKLARLLRERNQLYRLHPNLEGYDPYYSSSLNTLGLDTRITPAYETAGNETEHPTGIPGIWKQKGFRKDSCLLLRVESDRDGVLYGYGVVLGDNNACYDRSILLISEQNRIYELPIAGQYRPDLVENMPDQVNVGLAGFWIDLSDVSLPSGRYRIAMAAASRICGTRLWNESNRFFHR